MIGTRRPQPFFFESAVLLFVVSLMLVAGCDSRAPVSSLIVKVQGTVLLDDVPLSGARVTFIPISPLDSSQGDLKPMSYGTTDDDGKYSLRQADGTVGAVKGQHTVVISKPIDAGNGQLAFDSSRDAVPSFYREHGYLKRHVMPLSGGQQLDFMLSTIDPLLKNQK